MHHLKKIKNTHIKVVKITCIGINGFHALKKKEEEEKCWLFFNANAVLRMLLSVPSTTNLKLI